MDDFGGLTSPWKEPWPGKEDHFKWDTDGLLLWIDLLNDQFAVYKDPIQFCGVEGKQIETDLQNMEFLTLRLHMTPADARAVIAASKNRSEIRRDLLQREMEGADHGKDEEEQSEESDPPLDFSQIPSMKKVNEESKQEEKSAAKDKKRGGSDEPILRAGLNGFGAAGLGDSDDDADGWFDDDDDDDDSEDGGLKVNGEVGGGEDADSGIGSDFEIPPMDPDLLPEPGLADEVPGAAPPIDEPPSKKKAAGDHAAMLSEPSVEHGSYVTPQGPLDSGPLKPSPSSEGMSKSPEIGVDPKLLAEVTSMAASMIPDMEQKQSLLPRIVQSPESVLVSLRPLLVTFSALPPGSFDLTAICEGLKGFPPRSDVAAVSSVAASEGTAIRTPGGPSETSAVYGDGSGYGIEQPSIAAGVAGAIESDSVEGGGGGPSALIEDEKREDYSSWISTGNGRYPSIDAMCVDAAIVDRYGATPELPYLEHPPWTMDNYSNSFYNPNTLCNLVLYPPKNGPKYLLNLFRIPFHKAPSPVDWTDEMTPELFGECQRRFNHYIRALQKEFGPSLELTFYRSLWRNEGRLEDTKKELRLLMNQTKIIEDKMDKEDESNPAVASGVLGSMKAIRYRGPQVGDTVMRGPDWCWGNQDGGSRCRGLIKGCRQWHPMDDSTECTEVVVMWDHGLYGNYRYGYRGAYDVRIAVRYEGAVKSIEVGDIVKRGQPNWRWGMQDGGTLKSVGVVEQIHASVSMLCGLRVAVLWDKDKETWKKKGEAYLREQKQRALEEEKSGFEALMGAVDVDIIEDEKDHKHEDDDDDEAIIGPAFGKFDDSSVFDSKKKQQKKKQSSLSFRGFGIGKGIVDDIDDEHSIDLRIEAMKRFGRGRDPLHYVPDDEHLSSGVTKRLAYMNDGGASIYHDRIKNEPARDWREMDFAQVICKPLPRYRWALDDLFYDLKPPPMTTKREREIRDTRHIMVGDSVKQTSHFAVPEGDDPEFNPNYGTIEKPVVLRVEQSDPTRVEPREVYGDLVTTTWCQRCPMKLNVPTSASSTAESLRNPIRFVKRHRMFDRDDVRLKIGDRVQRWDVFWDVDFYGNEDRRDPMDKSAMGTVVGMCYHLQTLAHIVTVRWLENDHLNLYGWGYPIKPGGTPIYDVTKVDSNVHDLVQKHLKDPAVKLKRQWWKHL